MRKILLKLLEKLCDRLQPKPTTTTVVNINVGGDVVLVQQKKVVVVSKAGDHNTKP